MTQKAAITALKVAYLGPLIEAFLASKHGEGWSPTRLGKVALGDPNRVFQIREGMNVMAKTAEKIIAVIDAEAPGFSEKWVKQHARENLYEE